MRIITGENVYNDFSPIHTFEERKSMKNEKYIKVSELLKFINDERDNGNIEPIAGSIHKSFSPALCLSRILKVIK